MSRSSGWLKVMRLTSKAISRAPLGMPAFVDRCDLDDQGISHGAFRRQRDEIGIGGKAAVPIGPAIDYHGMMDRRQAGGGKNRLDGHLVPPEKAHAAGGHVGGRNQQLDIRERAQPLEIDVRCQQPAQRIEAERVELVGREQARGDLPHRRGSAHAEQKGIETQEIGHASVLHRGPHATQLGSRAGLAAFAQARGECHGIHRTRAGGAQPCKIEIVFIEQAIDARPT